MKIANWETIGKREKLAETKIFSVYKQQKKSLLSGRVGTFASVDAPDWVVAIPLYKKDGETYVIMVRQYRHGSDSITLEFPCGCVEKGEKAEIAACRELLEETGAKSEKPPIRLGSVSPNSAFMTNRSTVFLFEDVKTVDGQHLDENEEIEIVHMKLDDVLENYIADEKECDNSIMATASFMYLRYKGLLKKLEK